MFESIDAFGESAMPQLPGDANDKNALNDKVEENNQD
jgi:hypothetical protein